MGGNKSKGVVLSSLMGRRGVKIIQVRLDSMPDKAERLFLIDNKEALTYRIPCHFEYFINKAGEPGPNQAWKMMLMLPKKIKIKLDDVQCIIIISLIKKIFFSLF